MIDIYILLLSLLAGSSKGVIDRITLPYHYENSIFPMFKNQYWFDPRISGLNKYKNKDKKQGPKFIGSTNIFVFVTDLFHLSWTVLINSFTTLGVLIYIYSDSIYLGYLPLFVVMRVVFAIGFYLTYLGLKTKH